MHQQINKRIILYFFLFIILGTLNNKDLVNLELPKINSINIKGLDINSDQLVKDLEFLKMKNLFLINKFEIRNLLDSNNLIEEYRVFKKYPNTIDIEIIKTSFLAQINIDGKFFFIGSNGRLIQTEYRDDDLPYFFGNLDIQNFLFLKKIIDESNLDFSEIKNLYFFNSGRWDLEIQSDILIKLPRNNLKESLDLSLRLLNDKKFEKIKTIDVRQKNQIVINE